MNILKKLIVPIIAIAVIVSTIVGFSLYLYYWSDDRPRPTKSSSEADSSETNTSSSNTSSSEETSSGDDTPSEEEEPVETFVYVTNKKLLNNVVYTGYVSSITEKPVDDNGRLTFTDTNDYFVGTFEDGLAKSGLLFYHNGVYFKGEVNCDSQYKLTKSDGKLTYTDGTYYQGKFVNDKYEDENGIFSHHYYDASFNYVYDYEYHGAFHNGTNIGQKGSLYFPAKFNKDDGLWMVGNVEMTGPKTIKANQDCIYQYGQYESRPDMRYYHYFEGEGYFNGTSASYKPDITYKGKTYWYNPDGVCIYDGEYRNGNYNGKGEFSWDLDAYTKIVSDNFSNGTLPYGSIATKYLKPYYDGSDYGLMMFTGKYTAIDGIPVIGEKGTGMIRYDSDQSVYIGSIYVQGDNDFIRSGIGYLDFTNAYQECQNYFWDENSDLSTLKVVLNNDGGANMIYYEAEFNQSTNWIDGDGVVYFNHLDGTPYCYITGKFLGWSRVGDIVDVSKFTIREGYEDYTDRI